MSKYKNILVHKWGYSNERNEEYFITGAFFNKRPEGESIMSGKKEDLLNRDRFIITSYKIYITNVEPIP